MTVSIIAAVADNNAIGKGNNLLWHLPDDMKFFRKQTIDHHIIMGRKTFESIGGGKPLPRRTSVIISRQDDYKAEGCWIAPSLDTALEMCPEDEEVFVIGGGEVYKQALEFADKLYLTKVSGSFEGDVFFPEIDLDQWKQVFSETHLADEKHKYAFEFCIFERNS